MKKHLFNNWSLLIALNTFISFLFISSYKILIEGLSIGRYIFWIHENTKLFTLIVFLLSLLFLVAGKLQLNILKKIGRNYPHVNSLLKYFVIILLSVFASIIINYYFQYFQHLKDPVNTVKWIDQNTKIFFAGVLYLVFVFLLTFSLIGNIYISVLFTSVFLMIVGFIHYNKLNLRVEPLYPYDYKQFSQLKEVIPMVSKYISLTVIVSSFGVLIVLFIIFALLKNIKISMWMRGLTFAVALTMLYSYTFYPKTFMNSFVEKSDVAIVKWNQLENYETNGFLFGFLSNMQNDSFKKPEGYSKERVLTTAKKYINTSQREVESNNLQPNVVFLMSESFWDPTKLNLEFSEDPMPNLRQMMEQHSSGQILSPVYGGATANVEFEALTGFSTSFLNAGAIPYQDMIEKKSFVPTIVSDLEAKGYKSVAIHPFNKYFYKRNHVYNTFGFDKFLDQDTMNNKEKTPFGVINDKALSNEILDNIKDQKDPVFVHAVSLQNHMPYNPGAYKENKVKVKGLTPESTGVLETYTEGIRQADEALQMLVEELEQLSEPTVVVFWGDHLPILGENKAVYNEAKYDDQNPNVNEYKYSETPLLIYSNFATEQKKFDFISPFYLSPIVYELGGLQKPAFFNLLDQLREQMGISALKGEIVMAQDRQFVSNLSEEQNQLLEDYRLLQYDLLAGNQYSLNILYKQ